MVFDIDIDEELSKLTPEQTTARGTLNLLNDCSRIGIQDAACMVLAGREHILFDLDVFKEEEFKEFCHDMKNHLDTVVDHSDKNVERCLPHVMEQFNIIQTKQNQCLEQGSTQHRISKNIEQNMITKDAAQGFFQHVAQYSFQENGFSNSSQESEQQQAEQNTAVTTDNSNTFTYDFHEHHTSIKSIYDEWYGYNMFDSNTNNKCYTGGLISYKSN